jgi:hypothetical protein
LMIQRTLMCLYNKLSLLLQTADNALFFTLWCDQVHKKYRLVRSYRTGSKWMFTDDRLRVSDICQNEYVSGRVYRLQNVSRIDRVVG